MDLTLTPAQIQFFGTFGFLSFPGLLADRIAAITAEFETVLSNAHPEHNGTARSCLVPFIDQSEQLSGLLDDPRIHGIAASLLGKDFNYLGSDGNYYVGDTGWHSDGWNLIGIVHLKIALYLDPLTGPTGALRVIPGSHRVGDSFAQTLQKEISTSPEKWGVAGNAVPAVALDTQPGDILVFNHNLKHASFGGNKRRRMFTINLSQRYPAEHLNALRDYIGGHARFWLDRVYGEKMVATAGPQRRVHLEQPSANDGHLAELSRQARAKTKEPSRG